MAWSQILNLFANQNPRGHRPRYQLKDQNMKLSEILDALLFAACIGAPFAAFFYFYGG